jgi:two-component system sensor histidine kinase UhpB
VTKRWPTLTLAAWAAVGGVLTVLAMVGAMATVLSSMGFESIELATLAVGLGVGLFFTAVGVSWAFRVTAGLRALQADAVRRLRDPASRPARDERQKMVPSSAEMADLARVLDALQLRARVADEVAAQAYRSAEQSSAGVFELLSGLVAAEEATRGQLSAELHDTVAQTLAVARGLLREAVSGPEPERRAKSLAQARDLVEEAEEQLRAVMARARPAELREGDLASAVGALRRDFSARYLFNVRLTWPEQPYPLPLVSAVTVYRFFQEGLLNVVKHADVEEAEAALSIDGNELVAQVHDGGQGFVPGEVRSTGGRHVGLGLLRERARLAGGSLVVDTAPTSGTTLTLRLPLSPRDSALPAR